MITWNGIIGKIVLFFIQKIVGKKLDLKQDNKLIAAKSLLRLYHSICDLEFLTDEFLLKIRPFVNGEKPIIYDAWVRDLSPRIDHASSEFLNSLDELREAIHIYDPSLSILLSKANSFKAAMLGYASLSNITDTMKFRFNWKKISEGKKETLDSVTYSCYNKPIEQLEFEKVYRESVDKTNRPLFADGNSSEWVEDALFTLLEPGLLEETISPKDKDKVTFLFQKCTDHVKILKKAREALRGFIAKNFSIDDLLYVRKA